METNKVVVRRFIDDVHNNGNFALFNELFAADYVNRSAPASANNRAAREQAIRSYREAMPDLRATIDDIFAEGDRVALRWTTSGTQRGTMETPLGVAPASNRPVSIRGINIFRIADGKIAEEWIVWDMLGLAQQVGLAAPR